MFFGNITSAQIATVALNPGVGWRCLETLSSLGANDRPSLTNQQCNKAIIAMQGYFSCLGSTLGRYWRQLDQITRGIGASYRTGTLVHLDLVQESTQPQWGKLDDGPREALLRLDLPFIAWELEMFPLHVLICNGKTAFGRVLEMIADPRSVERGEVGRRSWFAGAARFHSREIVIFGWNRPLHWGLRNEDAKELGQILEEALRRHGILRPK
jgi:hypothetical protein